MKVLDRIRQTPKTGLEVLTRQFSLEVVAICLVAVFLETFGSYRWSMIPRKVQEENR